MLGAGAHLPPRFDLAALTDMPAEAREILVVNVLNVVYRKGGNLAPGGITSARGAASTAARAAAVATFSLAAAALALRTTEARSAWSALAFRARASIFSFLGVIRHRCGSFCGRDQYSGMLEGNVFVVGGSAVVI